MSAMVSQITSLMIVYSTVYWDADQSKHQSSASLAIVWGIHRGSVNSPRKGPVTRKMFPFDDVIMEVLLTINQHWLGLWLGAEYNWYTWDFKKMNRPRASWSVFLIILRHLYYLTHWCLFLLWGESEKTYKETKNKNKTKTPVTVQSNEMVKTSHTFIFLHR